MIYTLILLFSFIVLFLLSLYLYLYYILVLYTKTESFIDIRDNLIYSPNEYLRYTNLKDTNLKDSNKVVSTAIDIDQQELSTLLDEKQFMGEKEEIIEDFPYYYLPAVCPESLPVHGYKDSDNDDNGYKKLMAVKNSLYSICPIVQRKNDEEEKKVVQRKCLSNENISNNSVDFVDSVDSGEVKITKRNVCPATTDTTSSAVLYPVLYRPEMANHDRLYERQRLMTEENSPHFKKWKSFR